MLKTVTIGSMILCHLLTGKQITNENGTVNEVKKVLGEIIDIKKKTLYYEDLKKKEVKSYEENFLYVKENTTKDIFEINSNACMIVRPETEKESKIRIYGEKNIKKEKVVITYKDGVAVSEEPIKSKDFMKDVVLPDLKETAQEIKLPEDIKESLKDSEEVVKEKPKLSDELLDKKEDKKDSNPLDALN